jgi:multiple sugar transport system substrate-binding protein
MRSLKRATNSLITAGILILATISMPAWAAEKVQLTYMFWGSPLEREAQFKMCRDFEKVYPNIEVKAIYTPANYQEKISAMVAGGTPPDVAQLAEGPSLTWARMGVVMDLIPFMEEDPEVSIESRLPVTWYWYDKGEKTLGTNLAAEVMLLWYNKDIFDEAGVSYPPANADQAWTWDEFLDTAKKLTSEQKGRKTFGVAFSTWAGPLLPFIRSNEGEFFNEDVTAPLLESPETIEVLQKLSDLMNKHHVAPTPTQLAAFPSFSISMQTGQVAMAVDGQWALLDLAKARFNLGVAPVPVFKKPVCVELGSPNVIFSDTKHKKESWELYKWTTSAESVLPVLRSGLWMPLQTKWYKEPDLLERWIDPETHPPEYKEAVVDYLLKYGSQYPAYYIENWDEIQRMIEQGFSNLWLGKEDAKTAARRIAEELKPLLQGRTDR